MLLFISNLPGFAQMAMPDTVCIGATKTYSVNSPGVPSTYTWKIDGVTQASTKNDMNVTWRTAGIFQITVQEHGAGGCDGDIQSGLVYVIQMPSVRYANINATANVNQQLSARVFTGTDVFMWSPSVGLNNYFVGKPIFNYNQTVEYYISITTGTGCKVVDTLLVNVYPPAQPTSQFSQVFIPDAFSPNGDGHNDKLTPLLYKIEQFKYFRIYNRWGQLLFETKVPGDGWDGTYKGVAQSADVYTWTIEATGTDKRTQSKRGTTILIR